VAQLIAIEPDDVKDLIIAQALPLQGIASEVQDSSVVNQVPSASTLLEKLHALRNQEPA
jgi:hypothetical protein